MKLKRRSGECSYASELVGESLYVVPIASGLVATAVTVLMKWTLIGHYTRSEHPLWCSFVWRDEMMNPSTT